MSYNPQRSRRFGDMLDTALLLSVRDKLLAIEETWAVPDELLVRLIIFIGACQFNIFPQTDIKQYGWAYYLGPYTTQYRDTNEKIIVSTILFH